jgi:hypothetical protein
MRDAGLVPEAPYPGACGIPWKCRCATCGRTVSPSLLTVQHGAGIGCKYCSGAAIHPDDAAAMMCAAHLKPLEPYPGTLKPWLCLCTVCGKRVSPMLNNIRKGQGCEYCSRRKVDEADAVKVMRAAGFEPLAPYVAAREKWPCRCLYCGNEVTPLLNNVSRGVGCKHCAISGFDPGAPAVVYVMSHPIGSVKVGVCGTGDRNVRIAVHKRNGWEMHQRLRLPTGELAYRVEQAVLARLRGEYQLGPYMSAEMMPQGGWTETFDAELMPAGTMWKIVQELARPFLEAASAA